MKCNLKISSSEGRVLGAVFFSLFNNDEFSILSISSGISGENLTLTGSGVLGAASAGSQTITNNNTLAIANGTGLASNYTLTGAAINVTVVPRTLNVTLSTGLGE